jgi:hypothetical protein
MIVYPPDLSKPYTVLSYNYNGTYTVSGTEKIIQANISERTVYFGGSKAIFKLRKEQFLTHRQKDQLRWVKKHLGDRQHDKLLEEIYDCAIVHHIDNPRE